MNVYWYLFFYFSYSQSIEKRWQMRSCQKSSAEHEMHLFLNVAILRYTFSS